MLGLCHVLAGGSARLVLGARRNTAADDLSVALVLFGWTDPARVIFVHGTSDNISNQEFLLFMGIIYNNID